MAVRIAEHKRQLSAVSQNHTAMEPAFVGENIIEYRCCRRLDASLAVMDRRNPEARICHPGICVAHIRICFPERAHHILRKTARSLRDDCFLFLLRQILLVSLRTPAIQLKQVGSDQNRNAGCFLPKSMCEAAPGIIRIDGRSPRRRLRYTQNLSGRLPCSPAERFLRYGPDFLDRFPGYAQFPQHPLRQLL